MCKIFFLFRFKKRKELELSGRDGDLHNLVTLQAGLRTLHEVGPKLKRAISGNLDEMIEEPDPMHRVCHSDTLKMILVAIKKNY